MLSKDLKTMEEFRFIQLLNSKLSHAYDKEFSMEALSTLNGSKNKMDLDGLKCELKPDY